MKHLLEHRYLPVFLALGAVVAMLPALKADLGADDLVQRPFQYKASELPVQFRDLVPPDTGSLRRVISGLFGSVSSAEQVIAAKKLWHSRLEGAGGYSDWFMEAVSGIHLSFPVLHLSILRGVVEFDVGGTVNFKPADFVYRHRFGPETSRD